MYQANLFINGIEIPKTAAPRIDVINPATEEVLGSSPSSGPEEVSAAVQAAQRAFEIWRKTTPWDRSLILRRIGALIRERLEDLVTLVTLEIGKTRLESRLEVTACAEYFEWAAEEARRLGGYFREGRLPGSRFEVSHEPVGVVLALAAWNYPVILATRKISRRRLHGHRAARRGGARVRGRAGALLP